MLCNYKIKVYCLFIIYITYVSILIELFFNVETNTIFKKQWLIWKTLTWQTQIK